MRPHVWASALAVAVGHSQCTQVNAECPANFGPLCNPSSPEMVATAPEVFQATFSTSEGDFVIEVTRSWAPKEADRFYNLVRSGYYDDTRFYRVVPGFVVQWGPSGNPSLANVYNPTVCDVEDGMRVRACPSNALGTEIICDL